MFQLLLLAVVLALSACQPSDPQSDNSAQAQNTSSSTPLPAYQSQGDLDVIRQYGTLRILSPRFDVAEALPRDGLPVLDYQLLAEQFALEHNLKIEVVFVDGFDDLIPALLAGKGDVIVSNFTQSQSRTEQVAFTRAITQVNEWLIAPRSQTGKVLSEFKKISVPEGTVYQESLLESAYEGEIDILPAVTTDDEIMRGMELGRYAASVFDSNVARVLLEQYPGLERKLTLKKNRKIAWATRPDNPLLLAQLNRFLISHLVSRSANRAEILDWQQIKARGRIRMLTLNNPASYFMYRGELMGFDYELVKKFADDNKLHLAIIIKDSIPELIDALLAGEGDLIAASLSPSDARAQQGLQFTRAYLKVNEQLVGRAGRPKVKSADALNNVSIGVNPATVFYPPLQELAAKQPGINLLEFPEDSTEALIDKVTRNEVDYVVADSHLVAIEKAHHQNIDVQFNLREETPLVWAVRKDQNALVDALNRFIKSHYRGLFYNVTRNKYFKNPRKIQRYQDGRVLQGGHLSPFDELVKREANKYKMDWRLITAQMYQESRFKPKAKSFAGAQGLMQVLPRTGKELGYSNLFKPENGIAAGVAYMHWLEDRFSGEIELEEKIYFVLAAYNAGAGHVTDARKLAIQLGYNPNLWFGQVEKAMLLLNKPEYYKKARFGYVRGSEPVNYVREIRARYLGYLNLL